MVTYWPPGGSARFAEGGAYTGGDGGGTSAGVLVTEVPRGPVETVDVPKGPLVVEVENVDGGGPGKVPGGVPGL